MPFLLRRRRSRFFPPFHGERWVRPERAILSRQRQTGSKRGRGRESDAGFERSAYCGSQSISSDLHALKQARTDCLNLALSRGPFVPTSSSLPDCSHLPRRLHCAGSPLSRSFRVHAIHIYHDSSYLQGGAAHLRPSFVDEKLGIPPLLSSCYAHFAIFPPAKAD